jgi:hypothetical protein
MDLANLSEPVLSESLRRSNERWPEAAMGVGNLPVNESTYKDLF